MPPPFRSMTLDAVADRIVTYLARRRITIVHLHHTARRRSAWAGEASVREMYRWHTARLGWSDIAQHVTVGPDGSIWTGRSWDRPPASEEGYNGTAAAGPFMIEMWGHFDAGLDVLDGAQRTAVVGLMARVQLRWLLPHSALRLHRELGTPTEPDGGPKSCPGTGVDRPILLSELRLTRRELIDL